MKILMIAPQPFFETRGTPISVFQRLHALSQLGYEVDVITYHVGNDVEISGVTIYRTPNIPFIKSVKIGPSPVKLVLDVFVMFFMIYKLICNRYDVIHSHEEASFFTMVFAPLFRVKHVYDMHSSLPKQLSNFDFGNTRWIVRIFAFLENSVIRTADSIITIGKDLEEHVLQIAPEANHYRIENTSLYNILTVNNEKVAPLRKKLSLEGKQIVVYTGTFETYQGLDMLLDSFQLVIKDKPNAILLMVGGKAAQIKVYKAQAESLKLGDNVKFTGQVSLEDSILYLELADILVSPRVTGLSVPLKIYTYMKSGKAIIATKIQSHEMILDHNSAIMTDVDKVFYAKGILTALNDKELCNRVSTKSMEIVEEFYSKKLYLEKLDAVFKSLNVEEKISIAVNITTKFEATKQAIKTSISTRREKLIVSVSTRKERLAASITDVQNKLQSNLNKVGQKTKKIFLVTERKNPKLSVYSNTKAVSVRPEKFEEDETVSARPEKFEEETVASHPENFKNDIIVEKAASA